MSKGIYLCANRLKHESCREHNLRVYGTRFINDFMAGINNLPKLLQISKREAKQPS